MVTFSPQPRCNPPPLNDLASRSNEYLTSKRFFLTILSFPAIERCENRAPARSVPRSPTLSYRTPLPRLLPDASHCPRLTFRPPEPTYLLYHHTLTNSLPSRKQPTPLFSINSTLLLQKHRGGGIPASFKPPDRTSNLQNRTKWDKTMQAQSPNPVTSTARCQHRTAAGRQCRSLTSDPSSELCPHHAATAREQDFREVLTRDAFDFQRPQSVNNSLGALYNLLAEGRISPRRASVLAHISSLLLRTLPAIDYDNENYTYDDDESDSGTEAQAVAESAKPAPQPVPPGKEPLPKTAEEF